MGGQSTSSFTTVDNHGVWEGDVKIVPFLHAAGFCIARTKGLVDFPEASGFDVLQLRVRAAVTSPYNRTGFQAQVATKGGHAGYRNGQYVASFLATANWTTVSIPFSEFELTWRGQPIQGPPLTEQLAQIQQLGVSAGQDPNVPGQFKLELAWIRAGRSASSAPDTLKQASSMSTGMPSKSAVAAVDLKAVVIVSRHGIRTPYGPDGGDLSSESFMKFSHVWPELPVDAAAWGVPTMAGQLLTAHGELNIRAMGSFYASQARYAALLGSRGEAGEDVNCSNVFLYADNSTRCLFLDNIERNGAPLAQGHKRITCCHVSLF
eukprot:gene780-1252_t